MQVNPNMAVNYSIEYFLFAVSGARSEMSVMSGRREKAPMAASEYIYEPPVLVEVGDFADLTLGSSYGDVADGGASPYSWRKS
ncbi:MAG: lasso RiPP family leader peptide-containing protein [Actinomadura sp.]